MSLSAKKWVWGIGVGLDQVSQFQTLATSTVELTLGIALLELLWIATNGRWVEDMLDRLSFQATLPHHTHGVADAAPGTWSLREFSRFHKGIA